MNDQPADAPAMSCQNRHILIFFDKNIGGEEVSWYNCGYDNARYLHEKKV
jgi:hypothetical protein